MYFSVGILYSAADFLGLVESTPGIDQDFPEVFRKFRVASAAAVLDLCQDCEWVRLNMGGDLEITEQGKLVLQSESPEDALCRQLTDMIRVYDPPWAALLPRGRAEARRHLPSSVIQCLADAGLLGPATDQVVSWWDTLAQTTRVQRHSGDIETGRRGERRSMQHERERTGREPVWQSIESNLCGYDIQSVAGSQDERPLRIEVKASLAGPTAALFHLTSNEWHVAQTSDLYVFHLWSLQPEPRLSVVDVDEMSKHVPENQGSGEWETVLVPFSAVVPTEGDARRTGAA